MTCLGLYDSERLVDLVRRVRWCMVLERQMEGNVAARIVYMMIAIKDFQVKIPVPSGILCQRAPVG